MVYRLNEVGDKLELKSDINETYYFFTPINNLKVNDAISYYITYSVPRFSISYTFLETDEYNSITEENINKYNFNSTSDITDYNMLFKTVIKRDDTQKGLLLKMNLLNIDKDKDSFNISRINMTLSERKDQTFVINKNEEKYFFFDFDNDFFEFYDVFIFQSNLGLIKYYGANVMKSDDESHEIFGLYYGEASYIYINSKYEPRLRYINIKANETNSIILNVKFFKKNKFLVQEDNNIVNNIELCNMYPNLNEKYYLFSLKDFDDQYIFYNKLYGDLESYYVFLDEVNNLDDFLNNKKQNMKKFEYPLLIKKKSNMKMLTYFKCLNNSPTILDLYNINEEGFISNKSDEYIILQSNETKNARIYQNYNNINASFEYMGCELDENEFISIKFGEYEFKFDKNTKKNKLNNINVVFKNFNLASNSQKSCAIKVELGQNDNYTVYPLKEDNYTNTTTQKIFFVSPKVEEKYHYYIKGLYDAYQYYEGNEIYSFHGHLNPLKTDITFIVDVDNTGKLIEHNLTHLTYFNNVKSNSTFNVKKIKELEVDINKFFYMEKYSEYILPEIKSDHLIISIQHLYDSHSGAYPYIKINDHYFNYNFLKKKFQFIKLDKGDIFKIVNFDGYLTFKINILNISNFNNNIVYEKKKVDIKKFAEEKKITFYIEPFALNKNIKYVLHIFNNIAKSNYIFEIFNNFGEISKNITLEKNSTSNDDIEYTFESLDSIDSFGNDLDFSVIATDLETGYVYSYEEGKQEYIGHKDNKFIKPLIVFGVIVVIIIIILIVFFVVRKRKRENSSIDIKNNNLMNEQILVE